MIDCVEFGRRWENRLDGRGVTTPGPDLDLEGHASACPACQALGDRLRLLERATLALGPHPAVPAGFSDRVLSKLERHRRADVFPFLSQRLGPLAAAAVVLVGATLAWRAFRPADRPVEVVSNPRNVGTDEADAGRLSDALADATSATWKLASETSAPAARLGREVLLTADLAGSPRDFSITDSVRVSVDLDVIPSSEVLQAVGARVNAGVRPLSGTARRAFGFLSVPSVPSPPKG